MERYDPVLARSLTGRGRGQVGRDERDREAARRAGVAYMPYHKLCSAFELDGHLVAPDAPAAGSLAPAPFTGRAA